MARNKFRDGIGDYYKTNRKIEQEDRAAESARKKSGQPIDRSREKAMAIVLVILFLSLVVKSLFLDEVKNLSGDEEKFKNFADYAVSEEYKGTLEDTGILSYRVYKLYQMDPNGKTTIRYPDPDDGNLVQETIQGRYMASVRGYLFWILPIKHFSVTSETTIKQEDQSIE